MEENQDSLNELSASKNEAKTSQNAPIKTSSDIPKGDMVKNSLVIECLKKAQMLLAYGSENGILIEKKDIEVFTNFKNSALDGQWTPQEEADFWETYSNIAKSLGNVRVKEIEAILVEDKPKGWLGKLFKIKNSAAQRAASSYTFASLFFVLLMLLIQVYSLVGTNLTNKAKDVQNRISSLQEERTILWQQITQMGGKVYLTFDKTIKQNEEETLDSSNPQAVQINDSKMKLQQLNYRLWQQYMELTTIIFKIDEWSVTSNPDQCKELKAYYEQQDEAEKKYGYYVQTLNMNPEESYGSQMDTVVGVMASAQSPLDVLNFYILPLLYGLIGAFAYVLRSFTDQLDKIDYSRDSNIKFLLRLFLGALAGLTVRMFFDTNDTSGLSAYSPLAISFIVGYSVEFFFAMIDNLIKKIAPNAPIAENKQMSKEF